MTSFSVSSSPPPPSSPDPLPRNPLFYGTPVQTHITSSLNNSRHLAAALLGLVFFRDPNAAVPLHVDFKASSVYDSSPAAVAMLEDFATPFSPRPPDSNAGSNSTVVLSDCRFRPPPPQTEPSPPPWADDRSETQASPFLFVLDGGTVELLSPVFEASGQVFVAQVRGSMERVRAFCDEKKKAMLIVLFFCSLLFFLLCTCFFVPPP